MAVGDAVTVGGVALRVRVTCGVLVGVSDPVGVPLWVRLKDRERVRAALDVEVKDTVPGVAVMEREAEEGVRVLLGDAEAVVLGVAVHRTVGDGLRVADGLKLRVAVGYPLRLPVKLSEGERQRERLVLREAVGEKLPVGDADMEGLSVRLTVGVAERVAEVREALLLWLLLAEGVCVIEGVLVSGGLSESVSVSV